MSADFAALSLSPSLIHLRGRSFLFCFLSPISKKEKDVPYPSAI
jgi:hypothetical protein